MITFLTLLLIALIIGRIAAGYFAHVVPFLGALTFPLTVICIIIGILLMLFVGIKIYNDIRSKK